MVVGDNSVEVDAMEAWIEQLGFVSDALGVRVGFLWPLLTRSEIVVIVNSAGSS